MVLWGNSRGRLGSLLTLAVLVVPAAIGCSKLNELANQAAPAAAASEAPSPAMATSGSALTDETVVKYIKAYKALKAMGPDVAKKYQTGDDPKLDESKADFAKIDKAIKDAGFASYAEFVQANAKIAWAFNTAQGQAFMKDMDGQMADGERQLQEAIDNPDVPEATKKELRAQREKMRAEYAKSKKWANVAMKAVGHLTDQESADVIMRHRKELEALFRGK